MDIKVKKMFEHYKIKYCLYKHSPIYTIADAQQLPFISDIYEVKNLFLRNQKKTAYYLFSLPVNSSLTLKDIAYITMNKKVSFASDQDLMNILSVSSGSVSILNALNDDNKSVEYYISNDILTENNVAYHPNQNNETVVFNGSEITKILDGYKLHVL